MKIGDFVQYRNSFGQLVGRGILIEITTAGWYVVLDQRTAQREYWNDELMTKIS